MDSCQTNVKSTYCGHGHRGTKVLLPFLLLSHVSNEWNRYMNINSFTRIHCIIYNQCPECFFFEESCMLKINKSSFFGLNFSFFSEWQIYAFVFYDIPKLTRCLCAGIGCGGLQLTNGEGGSGGTAPTSAPLHHPRDTGQWGREPGCGASHGLQSWTVASVLLTSWHK